MGDWPANVLIYGLIILCVMVLAIDNKRRNEFKRNFITAAGRCMPYKHYINVNCEEYVIGMLVGYAGNLA